MLRRANPRKTKGKQAHYRVLTPGSGFQSVKHVLPLTFTFVLLDVG